MIIIIEDLPVKKYSDPNLDLELIKETNLDQGLPKDPDSRKETGIQLYRRSQKLRQIFGIQDKGFCNLSDHIGSIYGLYRVLYSQEVVTHFFIVTYYLKWTDGIIRYPGNTKKDHFKAPYNQQRTPQQIATFYTCVLM